MTVKFRYRSGEHFDLHHQYRKRKIGFRKKNMNIGFLFDIFNSLKSVTVKNERRNWRDDVAINRDLNFKGFQIDVSRLHPIKSQL